MKKSKLLIVLSIIFYCLAGSMSAVAGKLSEAMYDKAVQQYHANKDNPLFASLRTFGDVVDEDGKGLKASVKNKIFNLIKDGKTYAQYVESLGAAPPPPTGHAAPPPPAVDSAGLTEEQFNQVKTYFKEITQKFSDRNKVQRKNIPVYDASVMTDLTATAQEALTFVFLPLASIAKKAERNAAVAKLTYQNYLQAVAIVTMHKWTADEIKGFILTYVIPVADRFVPDVGYPEDRAEAETAAKNLGIVKKRVYIHDGVQGYVTEENFKLAIELFPRNKLIDNFDNGFWTDAALKKYKAVVLKEAGKDEKPGVPHPLSQKKLLGGKLTDAQVAMIRGWLASGPGGAGQTMPDAKFAEKKDDIIAACMPNKNNELALQGQLNKQFFGFKLNQKQKKVIIKALKGGSSGGASAPMLTEEQYADMVKMRKFGVPAGAIKTKINQKYGIDPARAKVLADAVNATWEKNSKKGDYAAFKSQVPSSPGAAGTTPGSPPPPSMLTEEQYAKMVKMRKFGVPAGGIKGKINQEYGIDPARAKVLADAVNATWEANSKKGDYAAFKAKLAGTSSTAGPTPGSPPPPPPHPSHSHAPPPPPETPGTPAGGSSSGWTGLTQAKYDTIVAGMPAGTGMIAQGRQRLYVAQQLKGITESSEVQTKVREAMLAGTSYADFKAANPDLFKEDASSTAGPTPGSPPPPPPSHGHAPPPPPPPSGSTTPFVQPDLTEEQVEQLAQSYDKKLKPGDENFANIWLESNMRGKELWGHRVKIKESQRDRVITKAAEIKAARDAASHAGTPTGFTDDGSAFKFADYATWKAACASLPGCIQTWRDKGWSGDAHPWTDADYYQQSALGVPAEAVVEYQKALHRVFAMMKTAPHLTDAAQWLGDAGNIEEMLNASYMKGSPQIYAEKQVYGADDIVVFFGDLHGDVHSLLKAIDALEAKGYMHGFEVVNPKVNLVFLGDCCDRGMCGVEVIYTLLRLALASPRNVTFVRGNHEDLNVTEKYGFQAECMAKLGNNLINEHQALYNLMPAVLYVGVGDNFLQCCHGGLEIGYKPAALLASSKKYQQLGELSQTAFLDAHASIRAKMNNLPGLAFRATFPSGYDPNTGASFPTLGFMWNDFLKTGEYKYSMGRGYATGADLTRDILTAISTGSQKLRGVVRAHQHEMEVNEDSPSNLMGELINSNGFYTMWQPVSTAAQRPLPAEGTVFMLNVAPDTPYGNGCNFGFATVAALQFKDAYEDWRFNVVTQQVVMPAVVPGIVEAKPVAAGPAGGSMPHHTGDASAASKAVDQLLGLNQTLQLVAAGA